MPHGRLNRKEIKRYNKPELLVICKENGFQCNSKSSKGELVEFIMKHKELRSSLPVKDKRVMSDKQKANLSKFRFKKSTTKEQDDSANVRSPIPTKTISIPIKTAVKVNPTSSNKTQAPPPVVKDFIKKDTMVAEKTTTRKQLPRASVPKAVEGKTKITDMDTGERELGQVENLEVSSDKKFRDKASFNATKLRAGNFGSEADAKRMEKVDNHTSRLRRRMNNNQQTMNIRKVEFGASTTKTSDTFDRSILNKRQAMSFKIMAEAKRKALKQDDEKFSEDINELGEEISPTEQASTQDKLRKMLLLNAQLKAGIISKEEFDEKIKIITELDKQAPQDRKSQRVNQLQQQIKEQIESKFASDVDELKRKRLLRIVTGFKGFGRARQRIEARKLKEEANDKQISDMVDRLIQEAGEEVIEERGFDELRDDNDERAVRDLPKKKRQI